MNIHHIVEVGNVDPEGFVVRAGEARHCVIRGGRILDLSGPVDPLTHLNRDFPHHALADCAVAERLERGAPACLDAEGRLRVARTPPGSMARLGPVDLDGRRLAWLEVHHARRSHATLAGR